MDGHVDEVHVWYGRMDQGATSETFVRRVLARYTDTDPQELVLARAACHRCGGPHGKPCLADYPEVHFNLSHSATLIGIAVSTAHEVGLDVQVVKAKTRTDAVAARFFSPTEHAFLGSLDDEQRRKAFFQLWARKEACLKATGEGLGGGLSTITVSSGSGTRRSVERGGARWTLVDLSPEPGYVGAVASSEGDWGVEERTDSDL